MKTYTLLILCVFLTINTVSISQTAPGHYWIQFTDKNTLGRSASITASDFTKLDFNKKMGHIKSLVKGSEKEP